MLLFTAECAPDYADILIRFRPKWPFLSREAVSPYAVSSLEALLADYPYLNLRLAKAYISVLVGNIIERFELEEVSRAADLSLPQRALIYLENNFQEPFTMDAMARSLGVSKEHLSRLFSKKIGVPFHRYVHSLRMEHAKKLLLTTGKSVTEIAYSCGFDCQRSFNRIFRDTFHLTPREYRAQQGALVPKEAKNAPNAVESPGEPLCGIRRRKEGGTPLGVPPSFPAYRPPSRHDTGKYQPYPPGDELSALSGSDSLPSCSEETGGWLSS